MGVGKKDFRAVCAALMGPDDGGNFLASDEEKGEDEEADEDVDMEGDEYNLSGDEDSGLSDLDSASSFDGGEGGTKSKSRKSGGKAKGNEPKRKGRKARMIDEGPVKLSSRQKDMVADIWRMLKSVSAAGGTAAFGRNKGTGGGDGPGSRIMGRDEVKTLVRDLGEMWTDEEVGLAFFRVCGICLADVRSPIWSSFSLHSMRAEGCHMTTLER